MRKTFFWAVLIAGFCTLLHAGGLTPEAVVTTGAPRTTNNDDSCDIALAPAATLLLPCFEFDYASASTSIPLVAIVNTSSQPQIVRAQIWSDWSYPVYGFYFFLTGYDVQAISLYDIVSRGVLPSTGSGSASGPRSDSNTTGNPNHLAGAAAACANLGGAIPPATVAAIQQMLSAGTSPSTTQPVGASHPGKAVGYMTFDVVATCSSLSPIDSSYYATDLLFDNVLTGDVMTVDSVNNVMTSSPLVHIRANPEGGPAGTGTATNFPYTFYDRFTPAAARKADRRQPLPGRFVARWSAGGPDYYDTAFAIWREGVMSASATTWTANGNMPFTDIVRFDESENPALFATCTVYPCLPYTQGPPCASLVSQANASYIPPRFSGTADLGGWIYFNLNNGGAASYSTPRQTGGVVPGVSQAWVVTETSWQGRFGTATDAAQLGNGCSPNVPYHTAVSPSANASAAQRFATGSPSTTGNDDSCDLAVAPAATLLLPYFAVTQTGTTLSGAQTTGEGTEISITNVTAQPHIAHVTIWSDRSYPTVTFNVYLTGYDVQRLNLWRLLTYGELPSTSSGAVRGSMSVAANANFDVDAATSCSLLPAQIDSVTLSKIQGILADGSSGLGESHAGTMTGYVTVDVVDRCTARIPNDWLYYTDDILFDNVLIGDFSRIDYSENYASSGPMVHIRAIPEGGKNREALTNLPFTFYDRYTPLGLRKCDRRQPLPGVFAARFIDATAIPTSYVIWREGVDTYDESRSGAVAANHAIMGREVVRFDESENPTVFPCGWIDGYWGCQIHASAAASRRDTSDVTVFPPAFYGSSDVAGWMYLNLNNDDARAYSEPRSAGSFLSRSQNWVEVSFASAGRYGGDYPATALSNGCSVAPAAEAQILPGANATPAVPCPYITACNGSGPAMVNVTENATFTSSGSAPADLNCGIAYEWNFGDGLVGRTKSTTMTHAYATGGTLTWTMKARQNDGRSLSTGTVCSKSGTILVCSYTFASTSFSAAAGGTSGNVVVTASNSACSWTATSTVPWITITGGASGTGSRTISFTVAATTSCALRTGTIKVPGATFTVSQAGLPTAVSPQSITALAGGQSGSVSVTGGASCAWTATRKPLDTWLTLSGTTGTGNGAFGYVVAANNTGVKRQTTVSVLGPAFALKTITIIQDPQANTGGGQVLSMIQALLGSSTPPDVSGDMNGDCEVTMVDVFHVINAVFAGGPPVESCPTPP